MPPLLPSNPLITLSLLAGGFAIALLAGRAFGHLKLGRGVATNYTRKMFHFTIFSLATLIQVQWGMAGVNAFAVGVVAVVLYGVARGEGHPVFEAMAREADAPHRAFFVIVPLVTTALGGLAANAVAGHFALVGYLVTGWGDAVGEPAGRRFGRHRYRVPTLLGVACTRSLEGSAAVGVAAFLAAAIALAAAFGMPPGAALARAAAIGAATAALEAFSPHGTDNFTTMVAAAALARWMA